MNGRSRSALPGVSVTSFTPTPASPNARHLEQTSRPASRDADRSGATDGSPSRNPDPNASIAAAIGSLRRELDGVEARITAPRGTPPASGGWPGGSRRCRPARPRPVWITYPRSAIDSAMFAFCSTTKIVVPSSRIGLMISKTWSTSTGARPIEGSSISSTFGFAMSARPIATICCSPPESVPAFCFRRSRTRGNVSSTRSRSSSIPAVAPLVRARARGSRPRSCRRTADGSPAPSRCPAARPRSSAGRSRPRRRGAPPPRSASRSPRIVFSVVVLPLALPPSRQTISPGRSACRRCAGPPPDRSAC